MVTPSTSKSLDYSQILFFRERVVNRTLVLFPHISGYRYFLSTDEAANENTRVILENRFRVRVWTCNQRRPYWKSYWPFKIPTSVLFRFIALGLLLGTFGLATVQLSILERRGELAAMKRWISPVRLAKMVLCENIVLLCTGLTTGVTALLRYCAHLFAEASAPGIDLFVMLLVILVVGVISGLFAVGATLQSSADSGSSW